MNTLKAALAAIILNVSAIGVLGASTAVAVSSQTGTGLDGVCSAISQSATSYITETQFLLSHDEGGAFLTRQLDTPIPAGTYDINALSYEPQHPNDPIPGQPKEQWKINLFSQGNLVFASGPTIDVPDSSPTTYTQLGANVEIASAVDSIQYVHYGYPELDVTDPADFVYNSVVPACVSFELVDVEEPITIVDPSCAIVGIFDEAEPAKLTIAVEVSDLTDDQQPTYQVTWGDDSEVENYESNESMMHVYASEGTYDVSVDVLVDGRVVATCDDPENVVENQGVTVVLGESTTSDDDGDTAVLAATGISPSWIAAIVGVALIAATPMLAKLNYAKEDI